jgi:acetylornithine deacetylase
VGVDALVAKGELDALKAGPIIWCDVADKRPCIGTGGIAAWTLKAQGKLFHSGLPQHGINAIELVNAACAELQRRFYAAWPAHPQEAVYGYATGSSMKPTQVSYPGGSVNQIPGECTLSGDIRLTPFYELDKVMRAVEADVADINEHLEALPTLGPDSKFVLAEEGLRGKVTLTWGEGTSRGLACDLSSPGYAAMRDAFVTVTGACDPMAITGTLPCIRDLQDAGFDVQTCGFGLLRTYHANNEFGLLADFADGFKVLAHIIANMEAAAQPAEQAAGKRARTDA